MTNPRNISIQDYTYSLPEEKIAKYPLAKRDDSKLLVYNNGEITEDIYKVSPNYPTKKWQTLKQNWKP